MENFLSKIFKAFTNSVPDAFAGVHKSRNEEYNRSVRIYYNKEKFDITGSMSEDKANYINDMKVVMNDYKVAAKKEIDKRDLILD